MNTDLVENLICVDCGKRLRTIEVCDHCRRHFATKGGRPSMFPKRNLELHVTLPASATDPDAIDRSAYAAPESSGQAGTGIYHFDRAHADALSKLQKGAVVIETGCGGAQLRTWCEKRGLRYIGIDVATTRVHDWLQEHGGADLFCDAHCLPFPDGFADAIYASAVYEHLAIPQLAAAEAARVLKPGGLFLGSMSFLEPWHDESYTHMSPNGIYTFITAAGMKPRAIWPEKDWPGFVALLKMGNKPTRLISFVGRLLNLWYTLPKSMQIKLRGGGYAEMNHVRATMAGAIAWIARKPRSFA